MPDGQVVTAPVPPAAATPAPPAALLRVRDVRLSFGGLRALDGVGFDVRPGLITSLIGPNGAGKTTLFNVISGLLRADAGEIALEGRSLAGLAPERISALGLTRSFQIARGFPKLTVFEHLMVYGRAQPGERWLAALFGAAAVRRREQALAEAALAVARRLKLDRVIDHLVGELSGGQKKLLEIGRALMAEPRLLLLDEPAAGVNPTLAEEIGDHLRNIVAEGRTILLVEHDMALVQRISDHVVVMAAGRLLAEGRFDAVRDDPAVQDAYLGARR
jgi:ABC-type branched-subunit amino acid transport system ATPase component